MTDTHKYVSLSKPVHQYTFEISSDGQKSTFVCTVHIFDILPNHLYITWSILWNWIVTRPEFFCDTNEL